MNRSFAHWTTLAAAVAALAFHSAGTLAQTVTITDPNCSDFTFGGSPGARTITCVSISPPPPGPPTCTSISGPAAGTIGTAINLTANCSVAAGSPAITGYQWTGGDCSTGSTCNTSGPAAATTLQYTVKASNDGGATYGSASPSKGVTWSAAGGGGGGGGGGGPVACNGFSNTAWVEEKWSLTSFPRQYTANNGGFSYQSALVIHFKTGATTAPGKYGAVTVAEFGSPPSPVVATLSATACDFGPGLAQVTSNSIQLFYQVGQPALPNGNPWLNPNTDYYVNIRNDTNPSCAPSAGNPGGSCDKLIDFTKPRGL